MSPIKIAVIAFCLGMTGVFLANMLLTMMVGEINRKRNASELLSYWGWTPFKFVRVVHEYRFLYPTAKLHIYMFASVALMAISGLALWCSLLAIGQDLNSGLPR